MDTCTCSDRALFDAGTARDSLLDQILTQDQQHSALQFLNDCGQRLKRHGVSDTVLVNLSLEIYRSLERSDPEAKVDQKAVHILSDLVLIQTFKRRFVDNYNQAVAALRASAADSFLQACRECAKVAVDVAGYKALHLAHGSSTVPEAYALEAQRQGWLDELRIQAALLYLAVNVKGAL